MARYITCDKCGKVLKGIDGQFCNEFNAELRPSWVDSTTGFYYHKDFCTKCADKITPEIKKAIDAIINDGIEVEE